MAKKNLVYEFDPIVYPRKLWVCINVDEAFVQEHFCSKDYKELSFQANNPYWAITFDEVFNVNTKKRGELVIFGSRNNMRIDVIAHEASHIVDGIENAINMEHGGEPSAYLFGWVCKSINLARMGKCEPLKLRAGNERGAIQNLV